MITVNDLHPQAMDLADTAFWHRRKGDDTKAKEFFLEALEEGLPDCCGVAVGVDRLMMLRAQAKEISDVIAFGWNDI